MGLLGQEKYLLSKNPQSRREAVGYRGASYPYLRTLLLLDARAGLNLLELYLAAKAGGEDGMDVVEVLVAVFEGAGGTGALPETSRAVMLEWVAEVLEEKVRVCDEGPRSEATLVLCNSSLLSYTAAFLTLVDAAPRHQKELDPRGFDLASRSK